MHRAPIDELLEGGADGSRTEAEFRGDLLARHGLAREHQQTPNAAVDLLEAKGLEEGLKGGQFCRQFGGQERDQLGLGGLGGWLHGYG